jgi:hypothetical protein
VCGLLPSFIVIHHSWTWWARCLPAALHSSSGRLPLSFLRFLLVCLRSSSLPSPSLRAHMLRVDVLGCPPWRCMSGSRRLVPYRMWAVVRGLGCLLSIRTGQVVANRVGVMSCCGTVVHRSVWPWCRGCARRVYCTKRVVDGGWWATVLDIVSW